jgi:hypothetical protein
MKRVIIHKITEELPGHLQGVDFEGKIGTMINNPRQMSRVTIYLPTEKGSMGFISSRILSIVGKDTNFITYETIKGIIIVEVIDEEKEASAQ